MDDGRFLQLWDHNSCSFQRANANGLQYQKQLLKDSRLARGENQLDLDTSMELIELGVQVFDEIDRIDSGEESMRIFRNILNSERKIHIVQKQCKRLLVRSMLRHHC
jgi:hypothetical protein